MTVLLNGANLNDEIFSTIIKYYEDTNSLKDSNILWDFGVRLSDESVKDKYIDSLISFLTLHAEIFSGGKVAIVARADRLFSFSNQVEELAKLKFLPIKIAVFRTFIEAKIWIDG